MFVSGNFSLTVCLTDVSISSVVYLMPEILCVIPCFVLMNLASVISFQFPKISISRMGNDVYRFLKFEFSSWISPSGLEQLYSFSCTICLCFPEYFKSYFFHFLFKALSHLHAGCSKFFLLGFSYAGIYNF